ncbi:MAG: hypothetical protein JRN52_03380 [Nitrososphaerota archaeon]|nr:hypothetical protein [Nitrososphaerota archaeon]
MTTEPYVNCQRCHREVDKSKTPTIITKSKTMYFCENCFHAVFKFDENLRTIKMIWEEQGMKTPFTVRSTNWHKSSYMVVKSTDNSSDLKKSTFIGDMYLRGVLKEQDKPVGKANHFIWVSWSEDLAKKFQEPVAEPSI